MRCPACGKESKRSSEANRRYWKLINMLSERLKPNGVMYSPESWHEYNKGLYLGMKDVVLPNGQVITRTVSSAELSTSEFNEYMTRVEVWCAENGICLEE